MRTRDGFLKIMLDALPDDYQKTEGFPIHDILSAVAAGLEKQNADIEFASNQNNVYQISGEHLEQFIYERTGLKRKEGTPSWGYLQITTNQNAVIPAGSLFATAAGLLFQTLTEATINNTTAAVYVECTTAGLETNVPANTVKQMAVTIAGVTQVTNTDSFTGGADGESDSELRTRYILHISNPSTSGNKLDYKEWALEVEGVARARVLPLWNGDNTVVVVLIGDNNTAPSASVVSKAQNYIDPGISGSGKGVAPIGAYCTCAAAVPVAVNVSVTVQAASGYTAEAVKSEVEASITEFFNTLDIDTLSVKATQVMKAVFDVAGVSDCSVPVLNGSSSVTITDTQIAVVGTLSVTVS